MNESKSILRVWTGGVAYDAVVMATLGGRNIGSGTSCEGDCLRDIDLEYDSVAARDAAWDRALGMTGIVWDAEKR